MHATALTVTARIDNATRVDDGLEVTRSWGTLAHLAGTLTPISLEVVNRLGLRPEEASHTLVLPHGLSLNSLDFRVVINQDAYDVVRVTNLPAKAVLLLRGVGPIEVPSEPAYELPDGEESPGEPDEPPPGAGEEDEDVAGAL